MKHDEEKIQEIMGNGESYSDNVKEYGEYIRNKTIDECILSLPDKQKSPVDFYEVIERIGFKACLLEARINMEKLY